MCILHIPFFTFIRTLLVPLHILLDASQEKFEEFLPPIRSSLRFQTAAQSEYFYSHSSVLSTVRLAKKRSLFTI